LKSCKHYNSVDFPNELVFVWKEEMGYLSSHYHWIWSERAETFRSRFHLIFFSNLKTKILNLVFGTAFFRTRWWFYIFLNLLERIHGITLKVGFDRNARKLSGLDFI